MPVTLQEVRDLILNEFPNAKVNQVVEESNHRIVGVIVWSGFKGMDVDSRNKVVREKVRAQLGLRGLNVGFLYPAAPGEK